MLLIDVLVDAVNIVVQIKNKVIIIVFFKNNFTLSILRLFYMPFLFLIL